MNTFYHYKELRELWKASRPVVTGRLVLTSYQNKMWKNKTKQKLKLSLLIYTQLGKGRFPVTAVTKMIDKLNEGLKSWLALLAQVLLVVLLESTPVLESYPTFQFLTL